MSPSARATSSRPMTTSRTSFPGIVAVTRRPMKTASRSTIRRTAARPLSAASGSGADPEVLQLLWRTAAVQGSPKRAGPAAVRPLLAAGAGAAPTHQYGAVPTLPCRRGNRIRYRYRRGTAEPERRTLRPVSHATLCRSAVIIVGSITVASIIAAAAAQQRRSLGRDWRPRHHRSVVQPGRTGALGASGRRFKSCRSDHRRGGPDGIRRLFRKTASRQPRRRDCRFEADRQRRALGLSLPDLRRLASRQQPQEGGGAHRSTTAAERGARCCFPAAILIAGNALAMPRQCRTNRLTAFSNRRQYR